MKFYTPCNNLPFQSVYRVKGGTEMDGPNRLEELVNTYETTLYRAALAILGDAHEAEDAVPFCAVWKRPRTLRARPTPGPGCCG